jgi:glycoside/pentoside/hexuronide:cation symporter, GPH family
MTEQIKSEPVTDKLSLGQKISFGFGILPNVLTGNLVTLLSMPIYSMALGVNEAYIGIGLMITKIWDAVTDPAMGYISDNSRSRWGRRRPFIALGVVTCAIFFVLLLIPPLHTGGKVGLFVYFTFISVMLATAYTIYIVPYNALAFELSYDYDERTRLMVYRAFIGACGGLLTAWGYRLCFLGKDNELQGAIIKFFGPSFANSIIHLFGQNEIEGVRVVAVSFAIIMLVAGFMPVLFLREKKQYQTQPKIKFILACKYTLINRPFLILCVIISLVVTGFFTILPMQQYVFTYYVYNGDKAAGAQLQGLALTVFALANIAMVPFIGLLGVKFGKKRTLLGALILASLGSMLFWILITPKHPMLAILSQILYAPAITAIWVMDAAMIADVTDVDELKTGMRREGMYGAVNSFLYKVSMAMALGLSGVIIQFCNIDKTIIGPQTIETIWKMRLFFTLLPTTLMTTAAFFAFLYPLTKEKCLEVRKTLNDRNIKCSS